MDIKFTYLGVEEILKVNIDFALSLQAKFFTDMPSETVSKIHLVDLAGR